MLTTLFKKRHRAIDVSLFVSSGIRHNYPNVGNKIIKTDTRGTRQLTSGKAFKLLLLFKDNRPTFFLFPKYSVYLCFLSFFPRLSFSISFLLLLFSAFSSNFCSFYLIFVHLSLIRDSFHVSFSDMLHFIDLRKIGFYLFFLD